MVNPINSPGEGLELQSASSRSLLIGELFTLFILTPCLLLVSITLWVKALVVLAELVYVLIVVVKEQFLSRETLFSFPIRSYGYIIAIRSVVVIVASIGFVYFLNPDQWFIVFRNDRVLWVSICLFYSVVSVLPQEFVYRSFFFSRYESLFRNPNTMVFVNAVLFSFAHIILKSPLVLLLSLIAGVLFAVTYLKTKSLLLTSSEHALYGCWLFTVGMGEMLAFPLPK